MSTKEIDPWDLARPEFTRGSLAAAERQVIEQEFSTYVAEALGMVNDGKEATVYLCRARAGSCEARISRGEDVPRAEVPRVHDRREIRQRRQGPRQTSGKSDAPEVAARARCGALPVDRPGMADARDAARGRRVGSAAVHALQRRHSDGVHRRGRSTRAGARGAAVDERGGGAGVARRSCATSKYCSSAA